MLLCWTPYSNTLSQKSCAFYDDDDAAVVGTQVEDDVEENEDSKPSVTFEEVKVEANEPEI